LGRAACEIEKKVCDLPSPGPIGDLEAAKNLKSGKQVTHYQDEEGVSKGQAIG